MRKFISIDADNIFAIASGKPAYVQYNLLHFNYKLQTWAAELGAVIPGSKSEILHVNRRRSCTTDAIPLNNYQIKCENNLPILGIIFSKNLLRNERCKQLSAKLAKINNILKFISSKKKATHIDIAIDICRSLVNGSILHGVTIFGRTP